MYVRANNTIYNIEHRPFTREPQCITCNMEQIIYNLKSFVLPLFLSYKGTDKIGIFLDPMIITSLDVW